MRHNNLQAGVIPIPMQDIIEKEPKNVSQYFNVCFFFQYIFNNITYYHKWIRFVFLVPVV